MATPTALEAEFLQLVNDTRAKAGAKPLAFDSELQSAAAVHNAEMDQADLFSHTGPDGSTPAARIDSAGYDWQGLGENIAWVTGSLSDATVQQLHTNLVNSPEHYVNIVNGSFENAGISLHEGTYLGQTVTFVTEDFGTPTSAERADGTGVDATTTTAPTGTATAPAPTTDTTHTPTTDAADTTGTAETAHSAGTTTTASVPTADTTHPSTTGATDTTDATGNTDTAQAPTTTETPAPTSTMETTTTTDAGDTVSTVPTQTNSGATADHSSHSHHSWGHHHGDSFVFNMHQSGSTTAAPGQTTDATDPTNTATSSHAGDQGFHDGGCGAHGDAGHADFSVSLFGHHLTGHADFHI
ncbi:CAP domain-containing protein [Methylobacterium planeticum]|uniref:CAP domain-containing protein n=1 Tax=Methylobacterium planeticum TaxID=2615211 RepID=A0A6N6MTP1_9HYPH|nr:CAP domain-containing protein [Methylobacterium planeticum]KAB1072954.1 CAP domain-containing protein [Methylobacterium planeticum]